MIQSLIPQIKTDADGSLVIREVSGLPRSAVMWWIVRITPRNGKAFQLRQDAGVSFNEFGLRFNPLSLSGSYTHDFCMPIVTGPIPSGCITVCVESWASIRQTRYKTNYAIRLGYPLPAGASVWVRQEGVWVDVTTSGVTGAGWKWDLLDSLKQIDSCELRQGTQVIARPELLSQVTDSTPFLTADVIDTKLGSGERSCFVAIKERAEWVLAVRRTTLAEHAHCDNHYDTTGRRSAPTSASEDITARLALAGQLLDYLADQEQVDCEEADDLLKRIQAELRETKRSYEQRYGLPHPPPYYR
jgi:hypothetical protein